MDIYDQIKIACDNLKDKKDLLYNEFLELDETLQRGEMSHMKYSDSNPFDMENINIAVNSTGSPFEGKRYLALQKAIISSAFQDDEFRAACVNAIQEAKSISKKDQELEKVLESAEMDYEKAVQKAGKKVETARDALYSLRKEVTEKFLSPVLNACSYRKTDVRIRTIPGSDEIAVLTGGDIPVHTQLQSLLNAIIEGSKPAVEGDIHKHLKDLSGEFIPGVQPVGVVYVSDSGNRASRNGEPKTV